MANALDLFVVPLYRRNGQDQAYLPGLHLLAAPKRAARGRTGERLILQLTLPPELALSADQQHALLSDLAEGYFRTPGSVTTALRDQFERLNTYFLQLNQRNPSAAGAQAVRFAAVSVREERVTLAHSGPQHAFQLNSSIQHFYDAPTAGRGLGLSSQTSIRFYQAELAVGDCFLLAPDIPGTWNEKTLSEVSGQKLSTLRRRFLSESGDELRAVLVMAQPGSQRISLMTSFEEAPAAPAAQPAQARPRLSNAQAWEAVQPETLPEGQLHPPANIEDTAAHAVPNMEQPTTAAGDYPIEPTNEEWPPRRQQAEEPSGFSVLWSEISTRTTSFWQRASPVLRSILVRLLPDEPVFNLPRQTLAIIAIVVPLAVVILVSVVYLQFGRVQLYQNYLTQAQSAATLAQERSDPTEMRQAWIAAVYFAERASAYEQDAEAAAQLLAEARLELDGLDLIERVDFQPALFSNLPRNTNIIRMVADTRDLYVLDAFTGKVIRAFLTSSGYQVDSKFSCEPGPYGGVIVSELVDIALVSNHSQGATVAALDVNGNMIFCIPEQRPLAISLQPPDSFWGTPKSIAIENGNLYVLDPVTNAVWIYFGEDGSFPNPPRFFFGSQVPSMQHIQDIALDGNILYMLDLDGHVVQCEFSDDLENPTTCVDPVEYVDTRPGQQSGPTVAGATFSELLVTEPPGPSIFFADPITPAVYQFSTRMNIVRQLRSQAELPEEVVSAFTISPNRLVFLAFGNQVFFGPLP